MTDSDIYAAVYDTVSEHMQNAGGELACSKNTFLTWATAAPVEVDLLDLAGEEDNREFLDKAYLLLLRRMVDKDAVEHWEPRLEEPPREFQTNVVRTIINSPEFAPAHVRVRNNLYSTHAAYLGRPRVGGPVAVPERLLRIYHKLPEPVKKAARKLMGVR